MYLKMKRRQIDERFAVVTLRCAATHTLATEESAMLKAIEDAGVHCHEKVPVFYEMRNYFFNRSIGFVICRLKRNKKE